MNPPLTFQEVSETNRTRCERWHPGFPEDGWTGSDWSNAMGGEAGEAMNVVKKLRRLDHGAPGRQDPPRANLLEMLAEEIADTFLYLDLLAQHYGIDLPKAVVDKFNAVSIREGFPDRLRPADDGLVACHGCGGRVAPGSVILVKTGRPSDGRFHAPDFIAVTSDLIDRATRDGGRITLTLCGPVDVPA